MKNITENNEYYFIFMKDGSIVLQRKRVLLSYDSPLTQEEKVIIALCERVLNPINNDCIGKEI